MVKRKVADGANAVMNNLISQTEAAALRGVTRATIHRLIKLVTMFFKRPYGRKNLRGY
jgi:hypothetical protein